jgi:membrane protein implicated in regulation of membrane protease activity
MSEFDFVFWYWWILALVLLVVELVVPGFFFLWMSAAGFVTGCLVLLFPATPENFQIFEFSVLSIAAIAAWRYYVKKHPMTETDRPLLNKRGAQYIGRVFDLYAPIENGQGKIKVDDTIWKVHGPDCPIGSKVRVFAVNGTVFEVERVE